MNTGRKTNVTPVAGVMIIDDGLHNFLDGLAIGASYSSSTYVVTGDIFRSAAARAW